jgi:hypothetical protein
VPSQIEAQRRRSRRVEVSASALELFFEGVSQWVIVGDLNQDRYATVAADSIKMVPEAKRTRWKKLRR